MKIAIRIVSFCTLLFLVTNIALGQTRSTKRITSKSTSSAPTSLCKSDSIPKGFVVVGYKSSAKCGENSELIIKKPSDAEVVCAGSPIPEGYSVTGIAGTMDCSSEGSNPLTNALNIAREGTVSTKPASANRAIRSSDDDEDETPRRTTNRRAAQTNNGGGSLIEQRAAQANAAARREIAEQEARNTINLAIKNHRVLVGMTKDQVLRAVGRPSSMTRDTTRNEVYEIWMYDTRGGGYGAVHIRDGVVVLVGARR